jgi:hypothetical protein
METLRITSDLERQLRITIRDSKGDIHKITYRERTWEPINRPDLRRRNYEFNQQNKSTNIPLSTKVGDNVYWLGSDFYMTKREGVVIEATPLFWDYSLPMGNRAILI